MFFKRLKVVSAVSAIAALSLTACSASASDEEGQNANSDSPATLQLTYDGTSSGAALMLGVEQGFFEEEGLDIEVVGSNGNPPSAIAAIQSNEIDIASVPVIPGLNAQAQGMAVTSIAPVAGYPDDVTAESEFDTYGVYISPDSEIESAKDLEGKKVGVNARKAIFEAFVTDQVMLDGGDPEKVEWVALDFSSQVEALKANRIDAIALPLPFTLEAEQNGAEMLWSPGVAFYEGGVTSTWMAGPEIAGNEEVVQKFQRAIQKSNEYANANREEAIEAAGEITGIEPDVFHEGGRFNYFSTELRTEDLVRVSEKLHEIGFIPEALELDESKVIPTEN